MRFYETNDISRHFSDITLDFLEIVKYFVEFCFHFQYCQEMTAKFWFLLNRFEISKFSTFSCQKLKKSITQLPRIYTSHNTSSRIMWRSFIERPLAKTSYQCRHCCYRWHKSVLIPYPGNTYWKGRLSTVDLLIGVAGLVKKVSSNFNIKMSWSKLI